MVEVTYVLTDSRFVKEGCAVLGIKPCFIGRRCEDMIYTNDFRDSFYKVPIYDSVAPMEESNDR